MDPVTVSRPKTRSWHAAQQRTALVDPYISEKCELKALRCPPSPCALSPLPLPPPSPYSWGVCFCDATSVFCDVGGDVE